MFCLAYLLCHAIYSVQILSSLQLYQIDDFQYGGHSFSGGAGTDQEPHVCLHLGLTDYRFSL